MKTINKVYTRTGDKGMTSLVGGVRIKKSDLRLEAYGTIDELNSHLGLLQAMMPDELNDEKDIVYNIQNNLFMVCTHLATDASKTPLSETAHIQDSEIEMLEKAIDEMMQQLPSAQGFILPGGCLPAAQCHVCRTVCRRAERLIVALKENAVLEDNILQYVNRLSDFLFVFAKKMNFICGKEEIIWKKTCK